VAGDLGTLGDALLERLGLPEGERLGLLEVGPTTVTLAREFEDEEGLPRSAPVLRAELETFPLASVLRAIHVAERSGLLRFPPRISASIGSASACSARVSSISGNCAKPSVGSSPPMPATASARCWSSAACSLPASCGTG